MTSSGLPWADSGGPTEYYAIGDCACYVSDRTLCSASPALQAPMADCGPWGGAGEQLLGATLFGIAGRRPNRDGWLQGGPLDAGRERALGAAGRRTRQAGASTSRRHWPWIWTPGNSLL